MRHKERLGSNCVAPANPAGGGPSMTDQEIRDTLIELYDEMYIPGEGPVGPVLLREFDRIMAERDAANGYLEKIDGMLGTAYPNEILAVLKEWRGARGEG